MFGTWSLFHPVPEAAARSETGPRPENQDNYLIIRGNGEAEYLVEGRPYRKAAPRWPRSHWRLCLLDGMGGHAHGREFAVSAAEALLTEPFGPRSHGGRRKQLEALHQDLHARWHGGPESPGSTLVWIDIRPNGLAHLAQVGDSRAFLLREGLWQGLTYDHSPAEFRWRDGDPLEGEPVPEHAITQALGYGSFGLLRDASGEKPAVYSERLRLDLPDDLPPDKQEHTDIRAVQLRRGDCLLLASDGLWSGGEKEPWRQFKAEGKLHERLRELLWDAMRMGADDNLTALACRMS
ncbi:MAG: protein phosphatase 2C domain-containing protein [Gammaproteobacteria bacterium]|nr:protein phosphatase 2C domain-containing protein [Gammaproteobacteria bacterium]MBU1655975.1 protein phosphatase 2C domain-containing protein [Gammaproteobacteria bacterium]MBU1962559.1 protein phosphatase 2C domain-containing protein [Gammaproteobacteria bacterium]